MSSDADWQRIKDIVDEALELPQVDRAEFLQRACGGDEALLGEVESLLEFDLDDDFLEKPALGAGGNGAAQEPGTSRLDPGRRLGPYEIDDLIGAGGMGQVYRARDTRLDRVVAIKTLPGHFAEDDVRRRRFVREARAISRLNHPNICTLYDIGQQDGVDYLVMEYIEGETLATALKQGRMAIPAALSCARQVAEGLERAHEAGIVHRDLKPGNVMLSGSGAKLLDFGLAKRARAESLPEPGPAGEDARSTATETGLAHTQLTRHGMILGTAPYMSPEQIEGRTVDAVSDQFSFGATLYEMLAGRRPFRGDDVEAIVEGILSAEPESLRELRPDVPADVDALVARCLARDPRDRFASTTELTEALREIEARYTGIAGIRITPRRAVAAMLAVCMAGVLAASWWLYDDVVRWLERDTLAEVDALTESGDLSSAFGLLYPIIQRLPRDPVVRERLERISLPVVINTEPRDATVYFRPYASDAPWIEIGKTPLVGQRIPYGLLDWRIERDGYETFVGAPFGVGSFTVFGYGYELVPEGERPAGMVKVPGGAYQRQRFPPVTLEDYWLDRYEVTNAAFAEFVAAGSYERPELWQQAFVDGERALEFPEAMSRFVDSSGVAGPAVWQNGGYGDEAADMPARGVSWFEAEAYCAFRGKALPTVFHWSAANRQEQLSDIVRVSNFGAGPAPVGSHRGLSDFGAYDLAGNVREWVYNDSRAGRYILGGAWSDPTYAFNFDADIADPWSRAETNGFRCARYASQPTAELTGPLVLDEGRVEQEFISDDLFRAYSRIFAYDERALDARVEEVVEEEGVRHELVSFNAAYGGERVLAHLFLPEDAEPPYQTVVWFPGNDAFFFDAGGAFASPHLFDFMPQLGRAFVYPVYRGMYQRSSQAGIPSGPNEMRDSLADWSKDLARTLDYLEQREDIDNERIAYYGFSSGAVYGPIMTAVDDRFGASILLGGGIADFLPPDMSVAAYAPRSTVPTLMINGVDDFIMPYALAQQPLFDLLGAPAGMKRHARLPGGHIPSDRQAMIDEILGWLDEHLGEVAASPGAPGGGRG
jgi:serine/threonine protein kinase/predicted esterase